MKKTLITINTLLLLGTHYINNHHIRYFTFTSIFTLLAFIIFFINIFLLLLDSDN